MHKKIHSKLFTDTSSELWMHTWHLGNLIQQSQSQMSTLNQTMRYLNEKIKKSVEIIERKHHVFWQWDELLADSMMRYLFGSHNSRCNIISYIKRRREYLSQMSQWFNLMKSLLKAVLITHDNFKSLLL